MNKSTILNEFSDYANEYKDKKVSIDFQSPYSEFQATMFVEGKYKSRHRTSTYLYKHGIYEIEDYKKLKKNKNIEVLSWNKEDGVIISHLKSRRLQKNMIISSRRKLKANSCDLLIQY